MMRNSAPLELQWLCMGRWSDSPHLLLLLRPRRQRSTAATRYVPFVINAVIWMIDSTATFDRSVARWFFKT